MLVLTWSVILCLEYIYTLKMRDRVQLVIYILLYAAVVELINSRDWYI